MILSYTVIYAALVIGIHSKKLNAKHIIVSDSIKDPSENILYDSYVHNSHVIFLEILMG